MRHTMQPAQWSTMLRRLMYLVKSAYDGDEIVVHSQAMKVLGQRYQQINFPDKKIVWIVEEK
jgi:hypothetical protein